MWFTRTADGFRGWIPVEQSNGSLRTGLAAGDFITTIVNPGDSAIVAVSMTESTKAGLYRFDIPSAFLVTHGIGEYGVVVEVDTFAGPSGPPHVRSTFGAVLKVSVEDFDSLGVTVAAILADTSAIDGRLPADPADESNQLAAHAQTQADVAAVQVDLTRILGLTQDNYMLDQTSYDSAGLLLSGRVRIFASAAALALATDGAADGADGEISRYTVTVVAATPGEADDYRFARQL